MSQMEPTGIETQVIVVTMRRENPFVAMALILLREDGFVPLSVQRDVIAWDNGLMPSQIGPPTSP